MYHCKETMKKIHGTTLFIGSSPLETVYGTFTSYVFQDIIDKKYVFALAHGDLKNDNFYIRMHSSCLTSETLRSMDCDCVHQLNGALERIVKEGNGILFYLLQSGRGASYIAKSRGCQMVQHLQDTITTFESYERMGLEHDYRSYRNVKDICIMFNIHNKNFHLMTNNPDKIKKFGGLGINIASVVPMEFPPNPFNRNYLVSKRQTGHILNEDLDDHTHENQPSIEPFEPYHLPQQRFIHISSYYLPIEPVLGLVLVDQVPDDYTGEVETLSHGQHLIKSNEIKPYWFKVNVYYDIATHGEILVLTYGDESKTPVVRIHSEFIFNRFPLNNESYRNKFSVAVLESVRNNSGIIVVANHNGHDYSIGNFLLDNESFERTGISTKRNLLPITLLLKHHLINRPMKIFYSDGSREEMESSFEKGDLAVEEWICIDPNDSKGHYVLQNRIKEVPKYLEQITKLDFEFDKDVHYSVTGIGTSEAHARYLVYQGLRNGYHMRYVPIDGFTDTDDHLVLFSQGLSPHGLKPLDKFDHNKVILFTSVTEANENGAKVAVLNSVGTVINYPLEDEYTLLIRTIGPVCGFRVIDLMFGNDGPNDLSMYNDKYVSNEFINSVMETQSVTIVVNYPLSEYYHNLKWKLVEGAFIKTVNVIDELSFAHGTYQNTEMWNSCFILVDCKTDGIQRVLQNYPTLEIQTSNIIELEHIFNLLLLKLVRCGNINQKDWPGKSSQYLIYNQ